jgi:hypothetical protein
MLNQQTERTVRNHVLQSVCARIFKALATFYVTFFSLSHRNTISIVIGFTAHITEPTYLKRTKQIFVCMKLRHYYEQILPLSRR